jgi:hypothetical protein
MHTSKEKLSGRVQGCMRMRMGKEEVMEKKKATRLSRGVKAYLRKKK